jgi:hypothetical protein
VTGCHQNGGVSKTVYKMYAKEALCLDLDLSLKISHGIYAKSDKIETANTSGPKHFRKRELNLYDRLGGLNDKPLVSHSSGHGESEMEMSAGLVFPETLLCLQFSQGLSSVCVCDCLLASSSYKDTSHIRLASTPMTSF